MTALSIIRETRIVAIIRGAKPDDVPKIVNALYEGGIKVLEITLNSQNALGVIKQISERLGDKIVIGAGTVLDSDSAIQALQAGAKFIISPSLDIEIIEITKQHGAISIPGAFTATEILTAYKHGGDIIKVFPASVGVSYFKDLRGPLSNIPLMPTGGVNLTNIAEFRQAGAIAFGVGSALVDTNREITNVYLNELTAKAKQYMQAVSNS